MAHLVELAQDISSIRLDMEQFDTAIEIVNLLGKGNYDVYESQMILDYCKIAILRTRVIPELKFQDDGNENNPACNEGDDVIDG